MRSPPGRPQESSAMEAAASPGGEETPEMVFERIARRRSGRSGVPDSNPPAPQSSTPRPLHIDEILFEPAPPAPDAPRGAKPMPPGAAPAAGSAEQPGGTFPRSATMRLLLRHPELALGVGLPAAGLLLGHPGSRRLVGAAIKLGVRPEIRQVAQLSSGLSSALRKRARQPLRSPSAPQPGTESRSGRPPADDAMSRRKGRRNES